MKGKAIRENVGHNKKTGCTFENYHSFGNIEMQQSDIESAYKEENLNGIGHEKNCQKVVSATPRMKPPKAPSLLNN